MRDKTKERLQELYQQAATEQNRDKLSLLKREIGRLLQEEDDGIRRRNHSSSSARQHVA
jgi:hypothetical protein